MPNETSETTNPPERRERRGRGRGFLAGLVGGVAGVMVEWWMGMDWVPERPVVTEWVVSVAGRLAVAGVIGVLAGVVAMKVGGWGQRLGAGLAAVVLAVTQSVVLARYGISWGPVGVVGGLVAGVMAGGLLVPPVAEWVKWLRGRVSGVVLGRVEAAGGEMVLVPDAREAVVVTCRLVNETALRGRLAAGAFLKLNAEFAAVGSRVLRDCGALTDEAEPGVVRGIFGLPLGMPVGEAADAAVMAAVALDDVLREFAERPGAEPVEWGIGLACGTLTAGLGATGYSVAGDAIERSKWLAQLRGEYQVRMFTDEVVHRVAERSEDRPLEVLHPPEGAAVEVYQLLAQMGGLSGEAQVRRDAFRDAVVLMRAGHAEDALRRFGDAREGLVVPDPVLERFVSQAAMEVERGGGAGRRNLSRNAARP